MRKKKARQVVTIMKRRVAMVAWRPPVIVSTYCLVSCMQQVEKKDLMTNAAEDV